MRLFLLLFVGCGPATGTIDLGGGDAIPSDTDTDTDADTDTDTDTDTDVEPAPEVDFSFWEGSRTLHNGDCAGILSEEGDELDEDWAYYDSSKDLCPECDHFYRIDVWPSWVCDVPINQRPYRALSVADDGEVVVLYWSEQDWDYVPLAENGQINGTELYYSYKWPWYDLELEFEGTVYFEEKD
jgi:hypothetical protein